MMVAVEESFITSPSADVKQSVVDAEEGTVCATEFRYFVFVGELITATERMTITVATKRILFTTLVVFTDEVRLLMVTVSVQRDVLGSMFKEKNYRPRANTDTDTNRL